MKSFQISLLDLIMSLSKAIDLINPAVANHQLKVAYVASNVASALGFSPQEKRDIIIAGALHDLGIFSYKEKLNTMSFEVQDPHHHAEVGYMLLSLFEPFQKIAEFVRFHHVPWDNGRGVEFNGKAVPRESHIIHIADRLAVLVNLRRGVLTERKEISSIMKERAGSLFEPGLLEALLDLSKKESFWLDLVYSSLDTLVAQEPGLNNRKLDSVDLLSLTRLFSKIIDFRSPFTVNHSSGVAACAENISRIIGFSREKQERIRIAGHLHDIGKLSVPVEILNKPAPLSKDEFNVILGHTYYTHRVLEPIEDLEEINRWASFHHEQLDGGGYPFRLNAAELSFGSRILAISDIFTAITEDRPYRKGMKKECALRVLYKMARSSKIDYYIVSKVMSYFDEINTTRLSAQEASLKEYRNFLAPPHL